VLSINESTVVPGTAGSDIQLGDLLSTFPAGTYTVGTASGFAPGVVGVGITHATTTFYTGTAGGHLVELDFHVLQTIPVGNTTLLDLVPSISGKLTVLADKAGTKYAIKPVLGVYAGSLTQAGALAPGALSPADADTSDVAIQVVAGTPAVTPKAVNDSFNVAPNNGSFPTTVTVSGLANGVLANDTDTGGPMNAVLVGGSAIAVGSDTINNTYTVTYSQKTAHGNVTLNALDGSFTYTPDANFTGSDSFTYQAVDAISNAASTTTTVTILVGSVVSIPQTLTIDSSVANNTVKVPVNIDNPNPVNSGGLFTVTIGVNYDKTKFTATKVDIGSVLSAAGWTTFVPNFSTPGRVDITASGPAITSTKGGDLADITLQVKAGAASGPSVVNLAGSTQLIVNGTGTPLVMPFGGAGGQRDEHARPG
jgi:hypothetical protein